MQQWLGMSGGVEIAELPHQDNIDNEGGARKNMLAEDTKFFGEQRQPTGDVDCNQNQDKRWENAADAAQVEIDEAEIAAIELIENDRADEVSRDDEEDVDADETRRHHRRKAVKADDNENS